MSALNSFAEELADGGLSNFEIENKRFTFLKKYNLLFIANSSKNVKEKKVMQEMTKIVNSFFNLYSADIADTWDNDVSIFSDFEKQIEDSLEETIKRFKEAFW